MRILFVSEKQTLKSLDELHNLKINSEGYSVLNTKTLLFGRNDSAFLRLSLKLINIAGKEYLDGFSISGSN